MPDETDELIGPEDLDPKRNAADQKAAAPRVDDQKAADPNDEIPVPVAMEPAEIDERARVVEALRKNRNPDATPDDPGMRA
jgi:hypothetical protein